MTSCEEKENNGFAAAYYDNDESLDKTSEKVANDAEAMVQAFRILKGMSRIGKHVF